VQILVMNEDGDDQALGPGLSNEGFDFAFARMERMFTAFFGKEEKAREVAETIVEDRHDLACKFATVIVRMNDLRGRNTVGVREDGDGIAAESIDTSAEIRDVANKNGIPAIGG